MKPVHFDLRHIASTAKLEVRAQGKRYPLVAHNETSLATAASSHPALSRLPMPSQQRFSHYADLSNHPVGNAPIHVQVVEPEKPGVHLPKVVAMTTLHPEPHLRAFWSKQLNKYRQRPLQAVKSLIRHTVVRRPRVHAGSLAHLGVTALPSDHEQAVTMLTNAQYLATPLDTAASLVSYHPNLANVQSTTSANIRNNHILPDPDIDPNQYNAMQLLATAIQSGGNDWSPVVPCKDQNGKPLSAGYDLLDPDGTGIKAGQQLYTYSLTDDVTAQLAPACSGANRSASDDLSLSNKTWAPNTGTTALASTGDTSSGSRGPQVAARKAAVSSTGFKWTVNEQTNHHGISVDENSISIDSNNNFSINASNSYLRTLYVGYQLYDQNEKPIGAKQLLYSVSATNTIMGIPMPTDPTALQLNMGEAASVELLFGSLGTTDWDADVSWRGALLTGLWQYGIPVCFLIAGKAITSSSVFNKIVNDRDLTAAALGIAFPIVGGGVATAAALTNTKRVLFSFGDVVLSLAVQKGMETLGKWLLAQVTAGAISNAFGPVGWLMRAAATGMDFEEMAVTTGEVLSSPACISATVSRAIDVSLTLLPDPRHGEAGNPKTAVWPSLAQKYVVTLQYKDGTNRHLDGNIPTTTNNTPLTLLFATVPAGGEFRIIAGVYSESGWLAGSWQSDWQTATPNQGTTLDLGSQNITENLVPLAPDTQYVFKERVVSQNENFSWQAGSPPTATQATLNCSGSSALCSLVSITLNNSAYQIGYVWRASGQNIPPDSTSAPPSNAQLYMMQNLSVLAKPGASLKRADIGLTNQPGIAYAPSTNPSNEIDQTNFVLDPRNSNMNLRQVVLNDQVGSFGLGAAKLQSWGQFPLANVDALAIHPSNLVLACSFKDSKLMMLSLPDGPSADQNAPTALLVSGEGIRQGLVRGPKALAVAPDGRILVLEADNMRVQAFDTKGNPVPSFTPTKYTLALPTSALGPSLDKGQVPDALATALAQSGVGFTCTLSGDFVSQLNQATFSPQNDPLIAALSQNGINLSYDPDKMSDPTQSATIKVVQTGQSWIITDPRGSAWQVLVQDKQLNVTTRLSKASIQVIAQGAQWLVVDQNSLSAWKLLPSSADTKQTLVYPCFSFFPLRAARVGSSTFLDMAVEAQGYVYVLSYFGDGSSAADYVLDVYAPDGTSCFRSPDPSATSTPQNVVAGKIAVDIWRNLYGLTFEALTSPWGTPQPGVGHWTPTPPLFTLALSAQPDLNQQNIGAVTADFASAGIKLSSQAFILVVDPNGTWQVKDQQTIYYIYRAGDGLQTYAIPA